MIMTFHRVDKDKCYCTIKKNIYKIKKLKVDYNRIVKLWHSFAEIHDTECHEKWLILIRREKIQALSQTKNEW